LFADAIKAGYPADRMATDFQAAVVSFGAQSRPGVIEGRGRNDAIQGIANRVFATDLMVPANQKSRDAPVSIPYLWDIWRLSWVEYDGMLAQKSATSRNIFEALGVGANTNFVNPRSGELNPEPLRCRQ
jgi:hypothetical protein